MYSQCLKDKLLLRFQSGFSVQQWKLLQQKKMVCLYTWFCIACIYVIFRACPFCFSEQPFFSFLVLYIPNKNFSLVCQILLQHVGSLIKPKLMPAFKN